MQPDESANAETYEDGQYEAFAAGWRAAGGHPGNVPTILQTTQLPTEPTYIPGHPMIYAKLAAVMAEVNAVGKDGYNEQQKYNFRGIDAVVNAIGPALRKHAVIVVPELEQVTYRDAMTTGQTPRPTREVTVRARYTFYAEDGSSVSAVVPGESLDQSDKGSAKAMSVAFRIALLQVFALPTSEPDPDASYHTRDGVGAMGEATKKFLLAAVPEASIPELDGMWAVVLEHSAAERAIAASAITWADYFAQRLAEIVADIRDTDEGRATYEELKGTAVEHLKFQDKPVMMLMRERAAAIKEAAARAFDQHVAAITNATSLEDLHQALVAVNKDRESSIITPEQVGELQGLGNDKQVKLSRELNQPGSES